MNTIRPPIVTVLGHVDHGKTTLLDAIRKTSIAYREAGGITQSIGATKFESSDGIITFVDTPGHAAFAKMRSRGAKVADIVVLVVAADDGIMPQTIESVGYIKENNIPFIVAITKIDLPSANVERVYSQLMENGVFLEGHGGNVPFVHVSAKLGRGIDELVEVIHLLAGVTGFTADPEGDLSGFVIEVNKDKRGVLVSAVIKNGTLKVGDEIFCDNLHAKVKGLFDCNNKSVREAKPSDPVLILGFSDLPEVGAEIANKNLFSLSSKKIFDNQFRSKEKNKKIAVILKVKNSGSLAAVISILPEEVMVTSSLVGDVTESDVFLAKASNAKIIAFEAKASKIVKRLAESEGVEISCFEVIYDIEKYIKDKLELEKRVVLGKAIIMAEFPFDKTRVAGCKIIEGRIQKIDTVILMRGEKELGVARISSMKREKGDLSEAKAGEECGIILNPSMPFEKNDILVATK